MDGATLISDVLRDLHGIDATDKEYAPARLRTQRNGQRALTFTWGFKLWPFRYVEAGSAVILANKYSAALPSDFLSFGSDGSVTIPALKRQLDWLPLREVLLRINGDPRTDDPVVYAEGTEDASGIRKLFVYPGCSVDRTHVFPYIRRAPTLTDTLTPPTGLEEIPVDYHETVIYEGALYYEMRDTGDGRTQEQKAEFMHNLVAMARDIVPGLEAPLKWPVYAGARRHYGRLVTRR